MEEKRSPYYAPFEVSLHNSIDDIWVSYLGKVYDLTKLCEQYKGDVLLKPIHEAAGQDISHWFDETTGDVRVEMSQLTNTQRYHTPHGRFVHVPPPMPHTDWFTNFGRPWWKDNKYEVGHLTTKTRQIRVINTLTSQEEVIEVCSEENMSEILQRYLKYNAHAASYTWKYNGVNLNMEHTLDENGIKDEDEIFYKLQVDSELYRQAILLYFNDDLTEL